jgi:adenosylmethionine-8-amino-7-oxononanoate aminotransferase
MFAFEHAGIDPDLVCLGKGLSGGYLPISATVAKERIFSTFADQPTDCTFYHGHTFAGNPIACAAALETLRIYAEAHVVAESARLGAVLAERMAAIRDLPGVLDVRCLGMIGAAELGRSADEALGLRMAQRVRKEMLDQRILIRPLGHVVYLMPPLVTPEAELTRIADLLRTTIARAYTGA